jgi:hypothetical protein
MAAKHSFDHNIFVLKLQPHLLRPRVEAGKNTSTVVSASRKRRRKENPVVSGETVTADLIKGYGGLIIG